MLSIINFLVFLNLYKKSYLLKRILKTFQWLVSHLHFFQLFSLFFSRKLDKDLTKKILKHFFAVGLKYLKIFDWERIQINWLLIMIIDCSYFYQPINLHLVFFLEIKCQKYILYFFYVFMLLFWIQTKNKYTIKPFD